MSSQVPQITIDKYGYHYYEFDSVGEWIQKTAHPSGFVVLNEQERLFMIYQTKEELFRAFKDRIIVKQREGIYHVDDGEIMIYGNCE